VKNKLVNKDKKRTEMSNITDKVAVVTTASSGIGEGRAKLFAEHAAKVALGARPFEADRRRGSRNLG
jgi:NAD(P)-dependent dehydrogenase (short-subunit alcohol dehydrogenase family)